MKSRQETMKVMQPESSQEDEIVTPRVNPPGQKSPEHSRRLIQKQLVLLLHARACQKKDVGYLPEERPRCPITNCEMMKEVWDHMRTCRAGPDCSYLHCSSSLKILAHWKTCQVWECPVCHLVRLKGIHQSAKKGVASEAQKQNEPHPPPQHELNGISGQSTKLQGLGQCQGQQQLEQQPQPDQMIMMAVQQPGSELHESHYHYNNGHSHTHSSSSHENTCQVETIHQCHQHQIHQQQVQFPTNQQPQSFPISHFQFQLEQGVQNTQKRQFISQYADDAFNHIPFKSSFSNIKIKHNEFSQPSNPNFITKMRLSQDELLPSSTTAFNASNIPRSSDVLRGTIPRSYLNTTHCQCAKCSGLDYASQPDYNEPTVYLNTDQITAMNAAYQQQILKSRKRSAEGILQTMPSTRPKLQLIVTDGATPSANDVRRAYEQLGIPCPSDALKRLMATLPGGAKISDPLFQEVQQDEVPALQSNEDEDDGINVDYNNIIHDECQASWCLSLVERFIENRNKQREQAGEPKSYIP